LFAAVRNVVQAVRANLRRAVVFALGLIVIQSGLT